ncbi:MAG: SHOCT domain-containing protein [Fusobacterium gastrosuis]|uniref:SHOCT domain-containing protein n=1 Tax=Fusobacterium gastrosuis TaxID=1755100 RepID=UPI002978692F|nr:SHOCT domain-containing protein [Fusobacteriaceae bacterium]MDY4011510.1 SHOCT domain-containing protein [Fusobacterium gastrosuis]MDY5714183.1 SHOCT domain-containing protein [Fusobacterium gastrosuis]
MDEFTEIITMIALASILGLIPAYIAKRKGYNFFVWWVYGFLILIVAFIHVCFLTNKKKVEENAFNELKRYKKLLEEGIISENEYEIKKNEIKEKFEKIKTDFKEL